MVLSALAACLAIALIGAVPAAAATHPTVISGTHAANIAIPTGSLTEMASLPIPAGRWLVIAKAMVIGTADDLGTYSVNCRLSTEAGSDFDVGLLTPMHAGAPNSRLPLVLTVVHHYQSPGEASLGCSAHVANSALINRISIQAIKVGTLTNGPIGSPGSTSGSGTPWVISAYRDTAIFTDEGDLSFPQDLPLPQGRWLIIAKAAVSGAQSGNIISIVQCRVVGMVGPDDFVFGDAVVGDLVPVGLPSSRMVMAVQIAGGFGPAGGWARFECSSTQNGHGFSWLKITAINLGKLTLRELDTGIAATAGTGTPRLVHGYINTTGAGPLQTTFETVATLPLPAGKWLVNGKFSLDIEGGSNPVRVDCRLIGTKKDESSFRLQPGWEEGPFWFQIIHSSSSAASVRLRCKRTGSGWTYEFFLVHISAMRVGTLTQLAI